MNFTKGILSIVWIYFCGFMLWQFAYSKGMEAKSCPRPGYVFDKAIRFGVNQ